MSKDQLKKPGKKDLRKEVSHQLEQSLGKLKEQLGEKKFDSRIKKAVKILTEDLDSVKKEQPKKAGALPKKAGTQPKKTGALKVSVDTAIAKELKKTDKALKAVIEPKKKVAKTAKARPEGKAKQ